MKVYSHNATAPAPIPFRIVLSNGATRTDPATFTPAEIADAGYVEAPPKPAYDTATQREPEWTGTDWLVADLTSEEIADAFVARKAAMLDAIRDKRWQVETGGIVVSGSSIRTDETSQAKITGANMLFDKDETLEIIDFEAQPNVWITIDRATMEAVRKAAGRHVQACFSHARALSEAVGAAEDHAALDGVYIEAGWPA